MGLVLLRKLDAHTVRRRLLLLSTMVSICIITIMVLSQMEMRWTQTSRSSSHRSLKST